MKRFLPAHTCPADANAKRNRLIPENEEDVGRVTGHDRPNEEGVTEVARLPACGANLDNYATKKSASQGVFNLALLISNCAMIKTSFMHEKSNPFFLVVNICLAASIVLQVLCGMVTIWLGRSKLHCCCRHYRAAKYSNTCVSAVSFLIASLNVIAHSLMLAPTGLEPNVLNHLNQTTLLPPGV